MVQQKKKVTKAGQTKKVNQTNKVKQISQVSENLQKDNSMKYLLLFIVVVGFALLFALLINKQSGSYMNDTADSFNVTPQVGKVIVARDMDAIYPKYYVAYTEGDSYSIYVYNYYETVSQYDLEFNRLVDKIVDYNAKDKMIRYLFDRGYGTYNEVLNNLAMIVNCNNLRIY